MDIGATVLKVGFTKVGTKVFVQIKKVFVKIENYICQNSNFYLSTLTIVFVKIKHVFAMDNGATHHHHRQYFPGNGCPLLL